MSKTTNERLTVTFSLEMANATIRGNFNPYIVSPEWLAATGIWEQDEVQLAFGAVAGGVRFRSGQDEWLVDNQSLQISSIENCGILAASVLRSLPHTPVVAIGLNLEYSCSDASPNISPNLGEGFELPVDMNFEVKKWSGIVHQDGNRVEMTVVVGSAGLNVGFNHHFATRDVKELIKFAESFDEKKTVSETMINDILKDKVL